MSKEELYNILRARGQRRADIEREHAAALDEYVQDAYGEPPASAQCPHCFRIFFAEPNHDPLKHHIDYCPRNPEGDDE